MTNKNFFQLFFSFVFLFLFSACSPDYPEGRDFSFYSVRNRIMNKWQWSLYREKGENLSGTYVDYTIEFTDGTFKICKSDGTECTEGKWFLTRDKLTLNLIYPNQVNGKDLNIIFLGRNNMTLETSSYAVKDTNYIKWDLAAVKRTWL